MGEDSTATQLKALKEFSSTETKELVKQLEEILDDVAKSGQYIFQWIYMKPLYAYKLEKVTSEFLETNPPLLADGNKDEEKVKELQEFQKMLLETFSFFASAPFTIQRISELLQHPEKHYKSTPKFFRGLEKNIRVVTTMEPVTPEQRIFLKRSYENDSLYCDQKPPVKKSMSSNENHQLDPTSIEADIEVVATDQVENVKMEVVGKKSSKEDDIEKSPDEAAVESEISGIKEDKKKDSTRTTLTDFKTGIGEEKK